ncbi:protein translocase subunit SecF [Candidatus Nomurabacteria bacterium]|nr:protein translocase subunit SecF [Candidatus Nomurabacteria bacterium]
MWIVKNRSIFIGVSVFFVLASVASLIIFGLKVGIDFKGGSLTEVTYVEEIPTTDVVQKRVEELNFGQSIIQPIGENGVQIKTRALSEVERQSLISSLNFDGRYSVLEKSFTSIGPSVGKELKNKSIISLILVAIATVIFIAYAFRKVSKPISSWKYGFITIITLAHDVIITAGIFTIISHFTGAEADTLFVVALLTVLGLSVNDTIVVFDRVRENITHNKSGNSFKETVGKSLNQTLFRSLNTSLSVIIVLFALFFVGPESTKLFALTLAIGMFFGTYSSIFVASPLLTIVEDLQKKK